MLYEVHTTIKPSPSFDFEKFSADCLELDLKPIKLENYQYQTDNKFIDIMIGKKFKAEFNEAVHIMNNICHELMIRDYSVIRNKLETSPKNEMVPESYEDIVFPLLVEPYFEVHMNVQITNSTEFDRLKGLTEFFNFHISKNLLKNDETCILTNRVKGTIKSKFLEHTKSIEKLLSSNKFSVSKTVVEYVLFDSNESHDNEWFGI